MQSFKNLNPKKANLEALEQGFKVSHLIQYRFWVVKQNLNYSVIPSKSIQAKLKQMISPYNKSLSLEKHIDFHSEESEQGEGAENFQKFKGSQRNKQTKGENWKNLSNFGRFTHLGCSAEGGWSGVQDGSEQYKPSTPPSNLIGNLRKVEQHEFGVQKAINEEKDQPEGKSAWNATRWGDDSYAFWSE